MFLEIGVMQVMNFYIKNTFFSPYYDNSFLEQAIGRALGL